MGVLLDRQDIAITRYDFRRDLKEIIPIANYVTHGLHPYTAKLIPHLPRHFIANYTQENDVILDPFCGSGTTLLEARLLARNAVGIDINPLAKIISEVKTTAPDINRFYCAINLINRRLKKYRKGMNVDFPNKSYWFSKEAETELSIIRRSIENLNGKVDDCAFRFLLVCFSSIIRKSSYADPRIAKTYKSKRVVLKIKNGWIPTPIRYFEEAVEKNLERIKLLSHHLYSKNNHVRVFQGDARETLSILKQNGIDEIDFIITSPPYINAQDYFRSYKLELWWLGLATPEEVRKLNKQAIGTENISGQNCNSLPRSPYRILNTIIKQIWNINRRKSYIVYNYFENMGKVFKESYNVLKKGGHFCLITGNNTICGVKIPTYKILAHFARDNGFKLIEIGRDKIRNRVLAPDRNHGGGIIKEEWITVFKKVE